MLNYNFESISSYEFECLSRDLLQIKLGIHLESFKSGRDRGIDLRHISDKSNSLIIQAKHYAGSGVQKLKRDLEKIELSKVKKLKPNRYIISTSVGLSPKDKDDILEIFSPYCASCGDIYGKEDLNNLLGQNSEIESRYYKLWLSSTVVLERILKSSILNRTQIELENIHKRMKFYVQNSSYSQAKKY
ncbi:restriction endonuclease [Nodosilinea sp. PGN35]|uniref:restriction endonuclease n=1 Tax=Nodosilinea sp. PGN35 TaxID=3020489 RepID=UPI0023B28681|nr:restriction endonuclease [Nodosilinea sp. TSF1-S3]MDF0368957.1 restriction endonuclease [Nodosilinea sp. TSF1-S3]